MSYGETFLLIWALGATAVAVVVNHHHKQHIRRMMIAELMLVGFIEGTARIIKEKDGMRFVNLLDDGEDEIYFQRRNHASNKTS